MSAQELFHRFQRRIAAVGGESHLVADPREAASFITTHAALAERDLVIPPGFATRQPWYALLPLLSEQGIRLREATNPASVADAPAGLSTAELAIAETGSVMLAENALESRVVSMLTLTHFVLVRARDLFPMLDTAGERLLQLTRPGPDQRRYISLVTGPSRTADIERTLTIGVQGPKAICVLFVENEKEIA
ncbi:MAG: lactate utilization protein [Ktedonobacteraceae bacterium]|nr:lactate utilization protein [Ktedonobacteraceae bacterium]MBO0792193.1 lactate utilization protein [Ktedonobacteraceae bacterium]